MRSTFLLVFGLGVLIALIVTVIVILPPGAFQFGGQGASPGGASNPTPAAPSIAIPLVPSPGESGAVRSASVVNAASPAGLRSKDSTGFNPIARAMQAVEEIENLKKSHRVSGYIFDPIAMKPVPNVFVQCSAAESVTGEADGQFTLQINSPGPFTVTVEHPGYNRFHREVAPSEQTIRIYLTPEGSVAGQVIDPRGEAVDNAVVTAQAATGLWRKSTRSDQRSGLFFFDDPPQSALTVSAEQEGFSDSGQAHKRIEPPFGEFIILRLDQPAFSISGRVLNADTKAPVKGVKVQCLNREPAWNTIPVIESGENGYYEFTRLRPGTYSVSVVESYANDWPWKAAPDTGSRSVRLVEGDAQNIDLEAYNPAQLTGRVVDSSNQPVQDANVFLLSDSSRKYMTDAEGNFTMYNLPPLSQLDANEKVQAFHLTRGSGLSEPLQADGQGGYAPVTIALQGPCTIKGTVVDETGAPVEGAHVQVSLLRWRERTPALPEDARLRDVCGPEGEFTLVVPVPFSESGGGNQAVPIYAWGKEENPERYSAPVEILLVPDQTVELTLTIALQNLDSISGRVSDSFGQPISNVQVAAIAVSSNGSYGGHAVSREDGSYSFSTSSPLRKGVYDLRFAFRGNPSMSGNLYQVPTGTQNADIVLSSKNWRVTGAVFDAQTEKALQKFGIFLEAHPIAERSHPYVRSFRFNSLDASYEIPFNEPGDYRLRFYADGYETKTGLIIVRDESNEMQIMNAQLQPTATTGSIVGRFAAPEGQQLVSVEALGFASAPASGGVFRLENLPPGPHDLRFFVMETASRAYYPIGVLTGVTVMAGGETDIGAVSTANLTQMP
ncbi:MAG: hypothetical protein GC154_21525 [bacterium]|nr:hypothetical protein [bacterium]